MFRFRNLALIALVGCAPSAQGAAPVPGVYTDEPRKDLKELIAALKEGEEEAAKLLSKRDDAVPYLRRELKTAAAISPRRERLIALALTPIEDRIYERNKKRYAVWAENGRFDLCAEFLVVCERKDGFTLADLTLLLRKRIGASFVEAIDPCPRGYKGKKDMFWSPAFKLDDRPVHEAATDLTMPQPGSPVSTALIRADRCTLQLHSRAGWFVAVRSELREELPPLSGVPAYSEWFRSVVLVNNSLSLRGVRESLIVCDGDIELDNYVEGSVVVANGDIRTGKGGGGRDSYFTATGGIMFPRKDVGKSVFHAGGTVTLATVPKLTDQVREGQKTLPFGVRFLDPEEFGITLTARKDCVQVSEVAKDSPFARYGVEAGDVVTTIDGEKTVSLPDFRRQLRRGLFAESAVLKLRRGDQVLTRIVFLDGIPIPTAPAPREVKP